MLGSPMVLFFLLPLIAIAGLFTGIGTLLGIDLETLLNAYLKLIDSPEIGNSIEAIMIEVEKFILSFRF